MSLYPVLTLKCTVGLVFIVNGALQVFMYVCMYVCMYVSRLLLFVSHAIDMLLQIEDKTTPYHLPSAYAFGMT